MKNLTKKLSIATATLAAAGFLAFGQPAQVDAAEQWEARTVEEVQADLAASEDGATTYTVKWGDTLGVIAKALDVDLNVLTQANSIANADQIVAGTTIIVSADHSTVTATSPSGQSSTANSQAQVVEQAPAQSQAAPSQNQAAPAQQQTSSSYNYSSNASGGEAAAKEWIAQRESNGSYSAYNPAGGYYGRYQLNPSLIHYGASPAEQEAAADNYVAGRYGSWSNAKAFWQANGWY